jgi:beta-N-acetylhexosaminidase
MAGRVLGIGITGTSLSEFEREVLEKYTPYSVILFSRNVGSADELSELVREIKSCGGSTPPLVVIDQEGGRVDRLRGLIPGIPGASATAEADNPDPVVRRLGGLIGEALHYFDIDVDLAPVVDIERETPVKGLERRTYGSDAGEVVRLAREFIRGLHSYGVASCLKHFPGLGLGHGDPHYGVSIVDAPVEVLLKEDLVPYSELAEEAGAVMIGHGTYPAIEEPDLPATLSQKISTELLRGVIGFEGVTFSDDMEMHAVSDIGPFEEIKERALMAGNDVVFFCSQIERMPQLMEHIERRLRDEEPFRVRFDEAAARAERFRDHCAELRRNSRSVPRSFSEIQDAFVEFCEDFEQVCRTTQGERRKRPRTPGTGKTGREEWT